MTLLSASPVWADVPRLEVSTLAQAGPLGAMTAQAQAMLDRTQYLRVVSDRHVALLGASGTAAEARDRLGLPDATAAYPNRGSWTTGTAYIVNDLVVRSSVVYQCIVAHTAGTFNTDQAAGYWAIYQGLRLADIQVAGGAALVGYGSTNVAAQLDTLVAGAASAAAQLGVLGVIQVANSAGQPHVGIGNAPVAENKFLVVSRESREGGGIVNGVQIQHRFDNDAGSDFGGSRGALRVINMIGNAGGAARTLGTTWAVTAIADLQDNITTGESSVALSGTVFKRGQFQHAIAGHLQVRDYVVPGAGGASPSVGCEINMSLVGPDNPTANNGLGNRHCLNIYAYTNLSVAGAASNRAEIGSGIKIQPDQFEFETDGGANFRNGIIVRDNWDTGGAYRVTQAGILIATGGQCALRINSRSSEANIYMAAGSATYGESTYGMVCDGLYTSGTAIRIRAGQSIAMDATNSITFAYNPSNDRFEFKKNGAVKGFIDMNGTSHAL